eukprot:1006652-Rhodomonas_salina.1
MQDIVRMVLPEAAPGSGWLGGPGHRVHTSKCGSRTNSCVNIDVRAQNSCVNLDVRTLAGSNSPLASSIRVANFPPFSSDALAHAHTSHSLTRVARSVT